MTTVDEAREALHGSVEAAVTESPDPFTRRERLHRAVDDGVDALIAAVRAAQRTEDAAIFDTALAEAAAESRAEYEAEPLDVARLHRAMLRHWSATMGNRLHVCVGGVGSCADDIAAEYARLAGADR